MRENKYKVWCKDKKKWEKDLSFLSKDGTLFYRTPTCGRFHIELKPYKPENHIDVFYTGLKDKNNQPIYEGDVVKVGRHIYPITISDFHGYRFMWGEDQLNKSVGIDGEIIGNIYENKEILTNAKKENKD